MTLSINKSYIEGLGYAQTNKLQPVLGKCFVEALEKTYGKAMTKVAMDILSNQPDNSYSGVKEFKARLKKALASNIPLLNTDDQKYIADYVKRVSINPQKRN